MKGDLMKSMLSIVVSLLLAAMVAPVIAETEDYLVNGRTWTNPRNRAMWLKVTLFRYNRRGCEDGGSSDSIRKLGDDYAESLDKGAVEFMTLGSLKAMYH